MRASPRNGRREDGALDGQRQPSQHTTQSGVPPSVLCRICPPNVESVEIFDVGQPVPLAVEAVALGPLAAHKRRREFALGRNCARAALAKLGFPAGAIGRDRDRGPKWPPGAVGSITHTEGYVAAIVAQKHHFHSLGVDAENIGGVTPCIAQSLFLKEERDWLDTIGPDLWPVFSTVLFSAKEAYYKAWNPLAGQFLGFHDLRVEVQGDAFIACHVRRGDLVWNRPARGHFVVVGDLVLTTVGFPVES
jgi:4'-phosphopantetheinyl transferase EntD